MQTSTKPRALANRMSGDCTQELIEIKHKERKNRERERERERNLHFIQIKSDRNSQINRSNELCARPERSEWFKRSE